jgi:bloom syndrome protein
MALTATAQNKVQDDIIRQLRIAGCAVLKQSFNRPNLHYEIRPKDRKVLDDMVAFINTQPVGSSGIIYCSSRDRCEDLAKSLRDNHGLRAWHYHAGMSKGDRRKIQEGWQEHKFEIIVATVSPLICRVCHHEPPLMFQVAFGMG